MIWTNKDTCGLEKQLSGLSAWLAYKRPKFNSESMVPWAQSWEWLQGRIDVALNQKQDAPSLKVWIWLLAAHNSQHLQCWEDQARFSRMEEFLGRVDLTSVFIRESMPHFNGLIYVLMPCTFINCFCEIKLKTQKWVPKIIPSLTDVTVLLRNKQENNETYYLIRWYMLWGKSRKGGREGNGCSICFKCKGMWNQSRVLWRWWEGGGIVSTEMCYFQRRRKVSQPDVLCVCSLPVLVPRVPPDVWFTQMQLESFLSSILPLVRIEFLFLFSM